MEPSFESLSVPVQEKEIEEDRAEKKRLEIISLHPSELAQLFSNAEREGQLESLLETITKDRSLFAHMSYWEKWIPGKYRNEIEKKWKEGDQLGYRDSLLPVALEKSFAPSEVDMVVANTQAIQLSFGCSLACKMCGFDALAINKGKQEHIPYEQLQELFASRPALLEKMKPFLYWASDVSDYRSKDKEGNEKRYIDVHKMASELAHYLPHVTTNNVDDPQWTSDLRQIAEDATKIRISRGDASRNGDEIPKQARGLTNQILTDSHIPMGKAAFEKDDFSAQELNGGGIGCYDGCLLTPRGVYNIVQVPLCKEFPQGQLVIPISKIRDSMPELGEPIENVLLHSVVCARGNAVPSRFSDISYSEGQNCLVVENNAGKWLLAFDKEGKVSFSVGFEKVLLEEKYEACLARWERLHDITNEPMDFPSLEEKEMIFKDFLAAMESFLRSCLNPGFFSQVKAESYERFRENNSLLRIDHTLEARGGFESLIKKQIIADFLQEQTGKKNAPDRFRFRF